MERVRGVAAPPTLTRDHRSLKPATGWFYFTMNTIVRKVSPVEAAELLKGNTRNRAINPRAVTRYAVAMTNGQWKVGNDAICIGLDGTLLNGQHRLTAIVQAGVPVELLLREGVDPDDLKAMDQGHKRLGTDIATLLGRPITRAQGKQLRLLGTDWKFTATITGESVDALIALDDEWAPYLELGLKMVPTSQRNAGIPTAIAAEALRWQGLDGRQEMIADFFSILFDAQPVSDRPLDSKGKDYLPCQFNRYVTELAALRKGLKTYQQYKLVASALFFYLEGVQPSQAKRFNVADLQIPASNPFRG